MLALARYEPHPNNAGGVLAISYGAFKPHRAQGCV